MRTWTRLCILVALAICWAPPASAHQLAGMSTRATLTTESITAIFRIAVVDILQLAPQLDLDQDTALAADEFELGKSQMLAAVQSAFSLTNEGEPLQPAKTTAKVFSTEGLGNLPHEIEMQYDYQAAPGAPFSRVAFDPNVFPIRDANGDIPTTAPPNLGFVNTVNIMDRGNRVMMVATGSETYETDLSGATPPRGVVMQAGVHGPAGAQPVGTSQTSTGRLATLFLWQGVLHILLGWDHVFFVIGLTLLATSLRDLVKVVTAFTISHSITLILTAMDIIHVRQPSLVEAVIALSIAYVGLENLLRLDKQTSWRWAIAFVFGLIHGMGFAGALRENLAADMPGSTGILVLCLLVFNVGVEVGQLLILTVLFPLLVYLRKHRPTVARNLAIAGSVCVLFMGTSWFIDRTFAPNLLPWVF